MIYVCIYSQGSIYIRVTLICLEGKEKKICRSGQFLQNNNIPESKMKHAILDEQQLPLFTELLFNNHKL